jgi:hypothetical protein
LKNLLLLIMVIFKLKCNNLIFNEIIVLNALYVCLHAFSLHRESPDPDPGRRTPHFWGGSVTFHNQGGRFKIISKIDHVLCVLLFKKGFMPSVLIAILIFLGSMANSGFCESMFCHYVTSAGCLIITASYLCFSLLRRNNSDSLFAN